MPDDFLNYLTDVFHIDKNELVPGDKHLNLEDLIHLPNPLKGIEENPKPKPMRLNCLDNKESIFRYVAKKDLLLHYPYHSFDTSFISCMKPCTMHAQPKSWSHNIAWPKIRQ